MADQYEKGSDDRQAVLREFMDILGDVQPCFREFLWNCCHPHHSEIKLEICGIFSHVDPAFRRTAEQFVSPTQIVPLRGRNSQWHSCALPKTNDSSNPKCFSLNTSYLTQSSSESLSRSNRHRNFAKDACATMTPRNSFTTP
jgi:hypothetical protein